MKGRAAAFALLFIFALAALTLGTAALCGMLDSFAVSSSVLLGDRAEAEGVRVGEGAHLLRHLGWEGEYDPATGESSFNPRWTLRAQKSGREYRTVGAGVHADSLDFLYSWSPDSVSATGPVSGWRQTLFDGLAGAANAPGLSGRVSLNSCTDYVPLMLHIDGAESRDVSEIFAVPLPGTVWLDLTLERSAGSGSIKGESRRDFSATSTCVETPEEYYLFFYVAEDGAPLETSGTAGGWGVYRLPRTETGANLDALEPVWVQREDFASAALTGSDGELLLFTAEDGGLYLNVIAPASGERTQRVLLDAGWHGELTAESAHSSGGFTAVYAGERFAAAVRQNEAYVPAAAGSLDSLPGGGSADIDELSFAYENGRVFVLEAFEEESLSPDRPACLRRLSVWRGTECLFAERQQTQLDGLAPLDTLPLPDFELITGGEDA